MLQQLFDACQNISDFPAAVAAHFDDLYAMQDDFGQIPLLDVNNPPENHSHRALVRFYAMVQDTSLSPEFYLAMHRNGCCGGWGIMHPDESDQYDPNQLQECSNIWATSIPGTASWTIPMSVLHGSVHSPAHPGKYPIPDERHIGVKVKIYDRNILQRLKVTDIQVFVGYLTSEEYAVDADVIHLVPTLHVLFSRNIPASIAKRNYPSSSIHEQEKVRNELITWIADEALAGDKEAAEWVLLSGISNVQSQTIPILPPSITLANFPSPTGKLSIPTLLHVLRLIFPLVVSIPLSLEFLNNSTFTPKYENDTLASGRLQLPSGTISIITEAGLSEGKLQEKGIHNLRALQEVMQNQSLEYKFPYSSYPFRTNIKCLVITEGRKSAFFQTDTTVVLRIDYTDQDAVDGLYKQPDAIKLPNNEKLEQFRELVGSAIVARFCDVSLSEETATFIREDFVQDRTKTAESNITAGTRTSEITADRLVHQMTIARLLANSLHAGEITPDIWKQVKQLDAERRARLQQIQ